ncbi:DUF3231 family protein [Litchfieldia alkalitelluris]|uniref:DUF3231 family protein n=1 Tax=Litchfieldia alkalitelluris TaxID=304268 RepID=UPI0022876DC7|nr:DUF3231 family protein [Litchfieldia alkalitelluris]
MDKEHNIRLTSAELSSLWATYVNDSMSICVLRYFLEKVKDLEIKPILQHAINVSRQHVEIIRDIFQEEGIPVPIGFTHEDVDPP